MASTPRQTRQTPSSSKRVLTSPVDLMDTKKSKANLGSTITEEQAIGVLPGSDEKNGQVSVDAENTGYSMMTLTLSDDQLSQITSSIHESINTQIENMVGKIVHGVLSGLHDRMTDLENENQQLKKKLQIVESRLDSAEQYSRRNCVRISGIPESKDESVDNKVMSLADAINSGLFIEEIDRAHRIGKPKDPSLNIRPRDIIVKFVSYRSRQKIMKRKSQLKVNGYEGAYINEDLTKDRREVFFQARALVREKRVVSAWSSDGVILVKDKNQRVYRIESHADLEKLALEV